MGEALSSRITKTQEIAWCENSSGSREAGKQGSREAGKQGSREAGGAGIEGSRRGVSTQQYPEGFVQFLDGLIAQ